jgi:hypothetical protein
MSIRWQWRLRNWHSRGGTRLSIRSGGFRVPGSGLCILRGLRLGCGTPSTLRYRGRSNHCWNYCKDERGKEIL